MGMLARRAAVEDGGTVGDLHLGAIDGDGHEFVGIVLHHLFPPKQMPARQKRCSRCSFMSSGKWVMTD